MRIAVWLLALGIVAAIAWAEPGTGTVVVGCNEDDAALLVDGVLLPERTPAVLTLPAGSHVIEVRKAPLLAEKKVVQVIDQQQIKVRFELLPPAPPPPLPPLAGSNAVGSGAGSGSQVGSAAPPAVATGSGSAGSAVPVEAPKLPSNVTAIDIATTAPHAIAYIDGAAIREAPCVLEVEPGEHVVAVYTTGMVPAEIVVTAKQGQRQRVEVTPSKPRKKIDVPAP